MEASEIRDSEEWNFIRGQWNYSPLPVFLNKTVLKHSHDYWLFVLVPSMATSLLQQLNWIGCNKDLMVYKNLKYSLSDSLQKKFADPCCIWWGWPPKDWRLKRKVLHEKLSQTPKVELQTQNQNHIISVNKSSKSEANLGKRVGKILVTSALMSEGNRWQSGSNGIISRAWLSKAGQGLEPMFGKLCS